MHRAFAWWEGGSCPGDSEVRSEIALLEIQMILSSIEVEDNATWARAECLRALRHAGWECRTEVIVDSRGDGRRGRVDIEAIRKGSTVGIEIDRSTPRFKSLVKLNRRDWLKVIATRGKATREFRGVDLQIALKLKTPMSLAKREGLR